MIRHASPHRAIWPLALTCALFGLDPANRSACQECPNLGSASPELCLKIVEIEQGLGPTGQSFPSGMTRFRGTSPVVIQTTIGAYDVDLTVGLAVSGVGGLETAVRGTITKNGACATRLVLTADGGISPSPLAFEGRVEVSGSTTGPSEIVLDASAGYDDGFGGLDYAPFPAFAQATLIGAATFEDSTAGQALSASEDYIATQIALTVEIDNVADVVTLPHSAAAGIKGASVASPSSVTVAKDGTGDFFTINDGLEALDYDDGIPDTLHVGPGVYDEQVAPKGTAGIDSVAFPTVDDLTTQAVRDTIATHTDPLTIVGTDPADPPVISYKTGADGTLRNTYGFFPSNATDSFQTTLLLCAKDVAIRNVEIRQTTQYAINGMASSFEFHECLFTNDSGLSGPDEDFFNLNNNPMFTSVLDPLIGLDNEVSILNGELDGDDIDTGIPHDRSFGFFYGFGIDAGTGEAIGSGLEFSGCTIKNWGWIFGEFRANEHRASGLGATAIHDCFLTESDRFLQVRGNLPDVTFLRNIAPAAGDSMLRLRENDGGFPDGVHYANNIVVAATTQSGALVRVERGGGGDSNSAIVNNTFYDYLGSCVSFTGSGTGTANIANNIFYGGNNTNSVAVTNHNSLTSVDLTNNGFENNLSKTSGAGPFTETGSVIGDPGFNNLNVVAPSNPGTIMVQGFVPTSGTYVDAGDDASYLALGGPADNQDGDRVNERFGGIAVDIGAQESDGLAITRTPTPTPTFTPSRTPTFTLTDTPSETPTLTPTHTSTSTFTPTDTPSNTPTATPTATVPTSTFTPTPPLVSTTPTFSPTPTVTPTFSQTQTPSITPSESPTGTPTIAPSETPTETRTETNTPSSTPTWTETALPSPTVTVDYDIAPAGSPDGTVDALDLVSLFGLIQDGTGEGSVLFDFARFWGSFGD